MDFETLFVNVECNLHCMLQRITSRTTMNAQAANPRPLKEKKNNVQNCQLFTVTAYLPTLISCIITSIGKAARWRERLKVQLGSRSFRSWAA
jgi:hypothetical protein